MAWGAFKNEELHHAVRCYGRDWKRVGAELGLTPTSCRKQYLRVGHAAIPYGGPAVMLPAADVCAVCSFGELPAHSGRGLQRYTSGGRPWEFAIRPHVVGRWMTDRQLQLVKLWKLNEPGSSRMLLCNLKDAEQRLVRHLRRCGIPKGRVNQWVLTFPLPVCLRDRLGMAFYAGDVCATVTSSNAAYNYVSFGEIGRFATVQEVAAFLGTCTRGGAFSSLLDPSRTDFLFHCVGESVHSRMAESIACVARSLFIGPLQSIGSLFSGGLDELAHSFKRAVGPLSTEFISELDSRKRESLAGACDPRFQLADASEAAFMSSVSVLVISPPCTSFSKARRGHRSSSSISIARSQIDTISAAILSTTPCLVILEQSLGLRSHHPDCYQLYCRGLASLPYRWVHGSRDAHRDHGSSHSRDRLFWVGVLVA